ncbi:hypothetical protein M1349_05545 [Patescibacteria group bacterium]|nr:hypothetical protein [Patescibacteria group bacterium]
MTKEILPGHSELTTRGLQPKLKAEEIIFMEDSGAEIGKNRPGVEKPASKEGGIGRKPPREFTPVAEGEEQPGNGNVNENDNSIGLGGSRERRRSVQGRAPTPEETLEFQQGAVDLSSAVSTPNLKNFLYTLKELSPDRLPEAFEDFKRTYGKALDDLNIERDSIKEDDPAREEKLDSIAQRTKALFKEREDIASFIGSRSIEPELPPEKEDLIRKALTRLEKEDLTREERVELIKQLMVEFPPDDAPMPDRILIEISKDEATCEEFLTNLIVTDLEDQPHGIKSFYGQTNLEKFLRVSRNYMKPEQRLRVLALIEASSSFHNMNYVMKKSFDQFAKMAEELLPNMFEALTETNGVGAAFREYDIAYRTILGKKQRITENDIQKVDQEVRKSLQKLSDKGIARGMLGGEMQDWELFRAFIYARELHRVTLRDGEQISLSDPHEWGTKLWTSPPQKGVAALLDPFKWTVDRFRINQTQGGPEYLKNARAKNREKSRRKTRLKYLEGTDVDSREFQSLLAARGVYATWRNAETILRILKFEDLDGKTTDPVQFLSDHRYEIAQLEDKIKRNPSIARAETEKLFKPMLENVNIALGVLFSSGVDMPTELKTIFWEKISELNPNVMAGLLTRLDVYEGEGLVMRGDLGKGILVSSLEEILLEKTSWWDNTPEKTALSGGRLRTLRREMDKMTVTLETMEAAAGEASKRSPSQQQKIDKLRDELTLKRAEKEKIEVHMETIMNDERWVSLSEKLKLANEIKLRDEEQRLRQGETKSVVGKDIFYYMKENGLEPNQEERAVIEAIIANGKLISKDLAQTRMGQTWFLDDTPISLQDWSNIGQFFDRQTGDLGNFQKAGNGIVKIVGNPFGEKAVENFMANSKEFFDGVAGVISAKDAQEKFDVFLRSWLDMAYQFPSRRPMLVSGVMTWLNQPTSRAQQIVGPLAPAFNEDDVYKFLYSLTPSGVVGTGYKDPETGKEISKNQLKELINDYKVDFLNRIIKANLRDKTPIVLFFLLFVLLEQSVKQALSSQ